MHRQSANHRFLPHRGRSWSFAVALALGLALPAVLPQSARADGCYICGGGSSDACKDKEYCQYSGSDTFGARKNCEKKGCRITGSGPCPGAGGKICMAPSGRGRDSGGGETIAWCAAPAPRSAS